MEEVHGIKLKKKNEFGLAQSEIKAVLRTLYSMAKQSKAKYIGICRDEYINSLLFKAGLGSFVIDLDHLNIFRNLTQNCPSNKDIIEYLKINSNKYTICDFHDRLQTNEMPFCTKVKAEFVFDYCNND